MDLLDQGVSLAGLMSRYQEQLARFTMAPADYHEYDRIMRDLICRVSTYADFRLRMEMLLYKSPQYAHLRVFWDVYHRDIIGNAQEEDRDLVFYPATTFAKYGAYLDLLLETHSTETTLPATHSQWNHEWRCRQNLRYYRDCMPPISNPHPNFDPAEKIFLPFLYWCEGEVARRTMRTEHYSLYSRFNSNLNSGQIPYLGFLNNMIELHQRDPLYADMLKWYSLLHAEATTATPIRYNRAFSYPLDLFVRLELSSTRSQFGVTHFHTH